MNDMITPTLLSEIRERFTAINRERWFRWMVKGKAADRAPGRGFFDSYPRFFSTSATESAEEMQAGAAHDRLNQRYRALIESNRHLIFGKNVLDLASHDGRWTFAAHQAGAKFALGIEARPALVESARATLREYGVPQGLVAFVEGDVFAALDRVEVGRFDTVFCFGFLYHTLDHMLLLRKIARLRPKHLIVDTGISTRPGHFIQLRQEAVESERNAALTESADGNALVGTPTREALEAMLRAAGFDEFLYFDWQHAGIERWDDLKAYYLGTRVSVTARWVCNGEKG